MIQSNCAELEQNVVFFSNLEINRACCIFINSLYDKIWKKLLDWTKIIWPLVNLFLKSLTCSRYRHPCMQLALGIRPDTVSSPSTGRLRHTQVLRLKITMAIPDNENSFINLGPGIYLGTYDYPSTSRPCYTLVLWMKITRVKLITR